MKIGLAVDTVALKAWRLSQRFHKWGGVVPTHLFEILPHWQEFESVGLAERKDGGVYIRGAHDHFSWLGERSEAGRRGGVESAKRNRNDLGQLLSKQTPSKIKQTQASSSSSSSSSISFNNNIGDFEKEFWMKYQSRNGTRGSKKKAQEFWSKLTMEEKARALIALGKQKQHYETCKAAGIFVADFPDAWRWLRDHRWEDEITPIQVRDWKTALDEHIAQKKAV